MGNIKLQAKAVKQILDELIKENNIDPPDAKGLKKWSKRNTILSNGIPLEEKYLSNKYSAVILLKPSDLFGINQVKLTGVLQELGYKDLDGFLDQNGYRNKNGKLLPVGDLETLKNGNPHHSNELLDKFVYTICARLIPGLIAISPVVFLYIFEDYSKSEVSNLPMVFVFATFFSFLYVISIWVTEMGRRFQEKYFRINGLRCFPTSYLMSYFHGNSFSDRQKKEFREKVFSYFQINLFTKEEERVNRVEALKLLNEVGVKVKNTVKKNTIQSSNVQYGLFRNLVPATLFGVFFSFICFIYNLLDSNVIVSVVFGITSLFFVSVHLVLRFGQYLRSISETYATYLLDEFLSR